MPTAEDNNTNETIDTTVSDSYLNFVLPIVDQVQNLKTLFSILSSNDQNGKSTTNDVNTDDKESDDTTILRTCDTELTKIEQWIRLMKHRIDHERPYVRKVQELRVLAEKQRDYIMYTLEPNIAAMNTNDNNGDDNEETSQSQSQSLSQEMERKEGVRDDVNNNSTIIHNTSQNKLQNKSLTSGKKRKRDEKETSDDDNTDHHEREGEASVMLKREKPGSNVIRTICEVSEQEMNSVPKYIKNRMPCSRVNESVRIINELLTKKYHLLTVDEERLSTQQLLRVKQLRRACKAHQGNQFFTEQELVSAKYKFDSSGKASLQVLRHLKRMREIRKPGQKEVAFVVL